VDIDELLAQRRGVFLGRVMAGITVAAGVASLCIFLAWPTEGATRRISVLEACWIPPLLGFAVYVSYVCVSNLRHGDVPRPYLRRIVRSTQPVAFAVHNGLLMMMAMAAVAMVTFLLMRSA
jgi:hypothetical protein